MRIFDVAGRAAEEGGEFVLGSKDTGTHACYLIYGTLSSGQEGRVIRPGKGHEEIVMVIKGTLKLSGPALEHVKEIVLPEGAAFHVAGDRECYLKNTSEDTAIYTCAGGHTPGQSH